MKTRVRKSKTQQTWRKVISSFFTNSDTRKYKKNLSTIVLFHLFFIYVLWILYLYSEANNKIFILTFWTVIFILLWKLCYSVIMKDWKYTVIKRCRKKYFPFNQDQVSQLENHSHYFKNPRLEKAIKSQIFMKQAMFSFLVFIILSLLSYVFFLIYGVALGIVAWWITICLSLRALFLWEYKYLKIAWNTYIVRWNVTSYYIQNNTIFLF